MRALRFIKDNRIIYKISVIGIVLMVLISVVFFIPNKEKNTVAVDDIVEDYIVYYPAHNKLYNGNKLDQGEYIEIDASSLNITCEGEDEEGNYVLRFNGVDLKTTDSIALGVWDYEGTEADVKIILEGKNKIEVLDSEHYKTDTHYGIANWQGNLIFEGEGYLDVVAKGYKGLAIYSSYGVSINSGNIYAYGGTSGDTCAIYGKDWVSISGGYVYAESSSNDNWVGGIETGHYGDGDSVSITGGKVYIKVSGDNESVSKAQHMQGAAIDTGKIIVRNCELDIEMYGVHKIGLYSMASSDGNGIYISDNAKVNITGDVRRTATTEEGLYSIGIYSEYKKVDIDNSIVKIDLKNSKDVSYSCGMLVNNSGSINIKNKGLLNVSTEVGYGVSVHGTLNIDGGHLLSQAGNGAVYFENKEFGTTDDSYTGIINVASDYKGLEREVWNDDFSNIDEYNYVEIGSIYDFMLYVDTDGTIYKNSVSEENKLSESLKENLGISTVLDNNIVNLTLNNTRFVTSQNIGLAVMADAKIRLVDGTENIIISTYKYAEEKNSYFCQVIAVEGKTIFEGKGRLVVDNIHNVSADIYTATGLKVGIIVSGDIEINGGDILIKGLNKASGIYGIIPSGLLEQNGGNVEIYGGNECLVIWGICLPNEDDLIMNSGNVAIDIIDTHKDVNMLVFGVSTNSNTNNARFVQNGGKVKICLEGDKAEVFGYLNSVTINDGVFEASAKKMSRITPTIHERLGIYKMLNASGEDISSPSAANMQYTNSNPCKYVKIIPNYFLIYKNGAFYSSYDDTVVTVSNCDVSESKIVMDGFEFETLTQAGLYSETDVNIELITGSKNSIRTYNSTIDSETSTIYTDKILNITGAASLELYIDSNQHSSAMGAEGRLTLDKVYIDIEIECSDKATNNMHGICTGSNLIINLADIDIIGEAGVGDNLTRGIYVGNEMSAENSDIDITVTGGKNVYGIVAYGGYKSINNILDIDCNASYNNASSEVYGIYGESYGIDSICDKIDINIDGYNAYVISTSGNINIESGQYVYIDVTAEREAISIGASTVDVETNIFIYDIGKMDINIHNFELGEALWAMGELTMKYTDIDIIFDSPKENSIARGIISSKQNLIIENCDVDIEVKSGKWSSIAGIYSGNVNPYNSITIKNSDIDITGTSTSTSGEVKGILCLGMTLSIINDDSDKESLNIEMDSAYKAYGIYMGNIESALVFEDINTYIDAYADTEGIGIYLANGMNISGGELAIKGTTRAIFMADSDDVIGLTQWNSWCDYDYDTRVIETDTVYRDSYTTADIEFYPDSRVSQTGDNELDYGSTPASFINQYKYIMIAEVARYGLRYDVDSKTMYKDYVFGYKASEAIEPGEDVEGWYVEDDILYLNEFKFRSSMTKALNIVGNVTMSLCNYNRIETIYVDATESGKTYGIYSSGNLTSLGDGMIEMVNIRHDYDDFAPNASGSCRHYSICAIKDLSIIGGQYRILGQDTVFFGLMGDTMSIKEKDYLVNIDIDIKAVSATAIEVKNAEKGLEIKDSSIDIDVVGITDYSGSYNSDMFIEGVFVNGKANISGGNLDIKLDCPKYSTFCIYVKNNMIINDGAYVSIETNAGKYSSGSGDYVVTASGFVIYAYKDMEISNSRLDIKHYNSQPNAGECLYVLGKFISDSSLMDIKSTGNIMTVGDKANSSIIGNIYAGTDYNGINAQWKDSTTLFNSLSSAGYKYIQIKELYDFYLYYNEGTMYNGDTLDEIETTDIPGWSVGDNDELILDNFNFVTSNSYGLYIEGYTTVILEEGSSNVIKTIYSGDEDDTSCGLYMDSNCTITGMGELDISSYKVNNEISDYENHGIFAKGESNISNINKLDINVVGGSTVYGMYLDDDGHISNSDIDININAYGYINENDKCAYAIYTCENEDEFTVEDSDIAITIQESDWEKAIGIKTDLNGVNIKNSYINTNIKCISRDNDSVTNGIDSSYSDVSIDGGNIICNIESYQGVNGIYALENVTLKNITSYDMDLYGEMFVYGVRADEGYIIVDNVALLDVNMKEASSYEEGLTAWEGINVTNSNIDIMMKTSYNDVNGAAIATCGEGISIEGGSVDIHMLEGDWAEITGLTTWSEYNEYGVIENAPINLNNVDVYISGRGSKKSCIYGITSWGNDVSITGGNMNIDIRDTYCSYAIYVWNNLYLSNISEDNTNSLYVEADSYGVTLYSDNGNVELNNVKGLDLESNYADWIEVIYAEYNYISRDSDITIDCVSTSTESWSETYGIVVTYGRLDIVGGTTTVRAKAAGGNNCVGIGCYESYNTITIEDAIVNIVVNSDGKVFATGIEQNNGYVDIDGSTIDIDIVCKGESWGIYSYYDVTINNSDKIDLDVEGVRGRTFGIHSYYDVVIEDVNVLNINVTASLHGYGIYAGTNIVCKNSYSNITCSGSLADDSSACAMSCTSEDISITGGDVNITIPVTSKTYISSGMNTEEGDIYITDADIDIDVNTSFSIDKYAYIEGIDSLNGSVYITGGNVEITGVATQEAWGIFARYDASISNVEKILVDIQSKSICTGITADYGDMMIANCPDIDISVNQLDTTSEYICGTDAGGVTDISNSVINIVCTGATDSFADDIYGSYSGTDIDLLSSTFNVIVNNIASTATAGIDVDSGNVNIEDTDTTINIVSTYESDSYVAAIDNDNGTVTIDGGTVDIDINAKHYNVEGIYSTQDIELKNLESLDISLTGDNNAYGIWCDSDSLVKIYDTDNAYISAISTGTKGYGISTDAGDVNIDKTDITVVGSSMAIGTEQTNHITVKGTVYASGTIDGTTSEISKTQLTTNFSNYKKVVIDFEDIINATISWGALDYTCELTDWNTTDLIYDSYDWTCSDGADIITVINSEDSTRSIKADVSYIPSGAHPSITGNILEEKASGNQEPIEFEGPKTLKEGQHIDSYLVLDGYELIEQDDVVVGEVTVTLTE